MTDLFASLGLFVVRGALDEAGCAALRAQMDSAETSPGGFFREHVDVGGEGDGPRREIAVVLFLEHAHRGGALVLYDLVPDARAFGFPFAAEEGTLLAFPADLSHEVQVVEAGRRYTVVTWFTAT